MDNGIVAADLVAVRQALGIDAWGLHSSASGANIALNMLAIDEAATSAWFATSPEIVGHGLSPNNMAEALQRYAADCAKAPTCAAFGDFAALFDAVLAKVDVNGATGVVEPGTGVPIVFDRASLQTGVRFAIGDRTLSPLLPMLLSGIVDGTQVDTVANYYVSQIPPMTPLDAAIQCQAGTSCCRESPTGTSPPAGRSPACTSTCTGLGPVPQFTEAPEITSSIPVMVVTTSYDSRSSDTNVTAITTGLSDVTRVFVPGLANSPLELGDCYLGVAADFFAGGPTDTSCMTSPAVATLNPA